MVASRCAASSSCFGAEIGSVTSVGVKFCELIRDSSIRLASNTFVCLLPPEYCSVTYTGGGITGGGGTTTGGGGGSDAVHGDAQLVELERQRLREPGDAGLGGGVVGLAEVADQAGA